MQDYSTLACPLPFSDGSEVLMVSPSVVCKVQLELNPRKAGDPDGNNNRLLRGVGVEICR
ncbi:hypothetical protein P5673_004188 [Acropora cervicornis]|uniref:Uncharacterized protein n=1 Tax=Acropora cervicornis TaxID=6130 RepID=A0AAD9QZS8_ACRCE|nr:hypothetical protein P5673_004188 [Acropora cervicornis]